ncbi:MAG: diguanylate cyclase [Acidobacteria bacterium]|nr:diguanylate cyclase [Acidobacteriota bacterium]
MKEILRKSATFPSVANTSNTITDVKHYLRLASIFEATTDLVATIDSTNQIIHINRAGQKMLGFDNGKAISLSLLDIYPIYERGFISSQALPIAIRDGVWSGETVIFSSINNQETNVSQVIIAHKNDLGQVEFFSTIARDITDLKKAEKALTMFAKVFESTQEGMMITDANNKILNINPAFTAITGYILEEVIGRYPNFLQSGKHDERFYQKLWYSINSFGKWQGEIWNRRKNGEIYAEWLTISTIKDDKGKITNHVAIFSDITSVKLAENRLIHLAHHDVLTGLPNRLLFNDRLDQALIKSYRDDSLVAVIFIDLDRFKPINDTFGHRIGDLLLQAVAERLRGCVREEDTVARLGGDEFTIILEDVAKAQDAAKIAKKIITTLSNTFVIEGHKLNIGASIGISVFPVDGKDSETLIKHADKAMYKTKESGRNGFLFYQP